MTDVDPVDAFFNRAVGYEAPHMILAAYMVTGFLVASVYAVGMLRGRRDRHHRLGLLIPLTVAAIATPIQFAVGDTAARAIAEDQPVKFAAMECVQETATHVTEYIGGRCTGDGVKGGIGIPGLDSWLVGFSTDTKVTGLDTVPPDNRPPANTMLHWAFDIMVGIGTALIVLGAVARRELAAQARHARGDVVPARRGRVRGGGGRGARVRLDRDGGRAPALDRLRVMRTKDAVTEASGVWVSLGGRARRCTPPLGTATVLVLRAMARRWRAAELDEADVPYGPRPRPSELPREPA